MASAAEEIEISQPIEKDGIFEKPQVPENGETRTEYPSGKTVMLVMIALYLAMFLVALDRTIISTAIPRITDDFHSLGDVGWYGSAYMLTGCAFLLLFGRIYTFYAPKHVFLTAIGLFEIGSAICGTAPNSIAFIIGRVVAGLGSAGVFSGVIVIMIPTVPLQKRPLYQGFFGAIFGIAFVVGPLLGGALTAKASWRWCFYINLPIEAVTILILVLILESSNPKKAGTGFQNQVMQLDPIGNLFFLPAIICVLLALQWGGSDYAWDDGRIIGLLASFAVLLIAFAASQVWNKEMATVPARIITQRSIAGGIIFSACNGASQTVLIYYLPIWFQAIRNVDAIKSGAMLLPLILSIVVASILAGWLVSVIGYYVPFMIAASIFVLLGTSFLTTLQPDTGRARWISYQILYGFGMGLGMQQPGIAAQTVLPEEDVPTGTALMYFTQSLSGAIFVSVAQNVFASRLVSGLANVVGLNPHAVGTAGTTDLKTIVPAAALDRVIGLFNVALSKAFTVALAMSCFSIIGALAMEWKSVKARKGGVESPRKPTTSEPAET